MAYAVPPSRREAVLRQLREEIVSGVLIPGAPMTDADLAARFQVSVTPVREAIAQLAAEGLVDITPNRTRHVTRVSQKNALELIDVMRVLSCAGVEWGVDNLTESDLAELAGQLAAMEAALRREDATAAAIASAAFSAVLILASGNQELQIHVDLVVHRTRRLLSLTAKSDIWQIWVDGYTEILAHLRAGRGSEAVDRYRHIYTEYRALLEKLFFGEGATGGPVQD